MPFFTAFFQFEKWATKSQHEKAATQYNLQIIALIPTLWGSSNDKC